MHSVQTGRVLISNTKYCLGRWDKAKRVVTLQPSVPAAHVLLSTYVGLYFGSHAVCLFFPAWVQYNHDLLELAPLSLSLSCSHSPSSIPPLPHPLPFATIDS
jgi:hypothetical protein